jgi:hypothetical protein
MGFVIFVSYLSGGRDLAICSFPLPRQNQREEKVLSYL